MGNGGLEEHLESLPVDPDDANVDGDGSDDDEEVRQDCLPHTNPQSNVPRTTT